jgi:hypothetical protein
MKVSDTWIVECDRKIYFNEVWNYHKENQLMNCGMCHDDVDYWSVNITLSYQLMDCGMWYEDSVTEVSIITWIYQLMDCEICHEGVDYWSVNNHMKLSDNGLWNVTGMWHEYVVDCSVNNHLKLSANGLWNVTWTCRLLKCELSHAVISEWSVECYMNMSIIAVWIITRIYQLLVCGMCNYMSIIEVWIITWSYQLMVCGILHEYVDYWSVNYHMKLSANDLWNVTWTRN